MSNEINFKVTGANTDIGQLNIRYFRGNETNWVDQLFSVPLVDGVCVSGTALTEAILAAAPIDMFARIDQQLTCSDLLSLVDPEFVKSSSVAIQSQNQLITSVLKVI